MFQISEEEAKIRIAKRIAEEFNFQGKNLFINLGVGIPSLVANYINNPHVFLQAENGILGVGPVAENEKIDRQLINASRQPITETAGCSYFDSCLSFGMIRGGHIDYTVIGAFEVDQHGNIANWIIPNGKQLGVGGAMDLVSGAKKVIIAMQHTSKEGKPKIVNKCTLPITGEAEADMIVTEWAVFCFEEGKLILKEIAPEVDAEMVRSLTEAEFEISPSLQVIRL